MHNAQMLLVTPGGDMTMTTSFNNLTQTKVLPVTLLIILDTLTLTCLVAELDDPSLEISHGSAQQRP